MSSRMALDRSGGLWLSASFGVLGVLLQAKRIGKIAHVAPIMEAMQHHGYRIAAPLADVSAHNF